MANKNYEKKLITGWGLAGAAVVIALVLAAIKANNQPNAPSGEYLTAASSLHDIHGLAVDVVDSSKVWIASHTGLHLLKDDKDLFMVGSARDDYMGFSVHPSDPNIFFSSGHPTTGGNIGLQKTTDAGRTWQKVSDGVGGLVDFHSMAVSWVNPNIIYGLYRGALQRSLDGGQSWENINFTDRLIGLSTDTKEADTVYATVANSGILVSKDRGQTWAILSEVLNGDAVVALAVKPGHNQELVAYGQKLGLAKSSDGGKTWDKIDAPWAGSMITYISYDKNRPSTIYAATQSTEIYKTTDSGVNWSKVR